MIFSPTKLSGSYIIDINTIVDDRGWFARYYCKKDFEEIGYQKEWVQLNHSFTKYKCSIRGMHYQLPPFSEIKLVRCIHGSVFDVIVDVRKNSATFLQWFGAELSAENKKMIYIPEGFAHGFQTLTDDCELLYHHSEFYVQGAEAGILYNEPLIQIEWPLTVNVISKRDLQHPQLTNSFEGI
ncbi:MAG TPA: dTDP-4-dehydrorhamnose 3,5-epimerase [Puia sp.]|jgi:dTDP-4-dehydrorhamnose 3,5-epimerase|nr:dTDP-4-dehydrorhamnose 3,5-epimerase [Puia sp.]